MPNLNCPSCGGSIEGVSTHIRSIDCSYCGSWLRLNNQLWQASVGQQVALNAPSYLSVGLQGSSPNGDQYTVAGRLRLQYENDSWDEWWIENQSGNGTGFWIEEDDGVYYRHINTQEIEFNASSLNSGVGDELALSNGLTLFITEKFDAIISGREGFLPTEPETNTVVTYMDGVAGGKEYSLEIEDGHASISQGEVFDLHSVKWDKA